MSYAEKDQFECRILWLYTLFIVGLTAGGAVAFAVDFGFADEGGLRYLTAAFLRSMPLFILAAVPGKRAPALFAVAAHGLILGAAGGCALMMSPRTYELYVLPRLLAVTPPLIAEAAFGMEKHSAAFRYSTVFFLSLRALLFTVFSSCVQFAFFCVFTQFNRFLQQIF